MKKHLFAAALVLLTTLSCTDRLYEEGEYTDILHVLAEPFDGIEVQDGFQLVLDPTVPPQEVKITVAENIHPYVTVRAEDGIVTVGLRSGVSYSELHLEARVSPLGINLLSASGGSTINADYPLLRDNFDLYLSGGSQATLKGSVTNLQTSLSGGSRAKLQDCYAQRLEAELSGGSYECVSVIESLKLDASGGSVFEYYGSPLQKVVNTSGGSKCDNLGKL